MLQCKTVMKSIVILSDHKTYIVLRKSPGSYIEKKGREGGRSGKNGGKGERKEGGRKRNEGRQKKVKEKIKFETE